MYTYSAIDKYNFKAISCVTKYTSKTYFLYKFNRNRPQFEEDYILENKLFIVKHAYTVKYLIRI